jgi:hypothetical protein
MTMILPYPDRGPDRRLLALIAAMACALAMSACSKCDTPDWSWHRNPPVPPQSCHDDAGTR